MVYLSFALLNKILQKFQEFVKRWITKNTCGQGRSCKK